MAKPLYRNMTRSELDTALEWAVAEGWNPGLDDAAAFFSTDPGGFLVAEVAGQPAAVISVVNQNADIAFLGLYICHPSFRGQGISYGLWTHALEHAGDRTVGLDGVPDQQANYRKSGFEAVGETRRFSGVLPDAQAEGVRPIAPADVQTLTSLEARANGFAKPQFLQAWFADTPTRKTFVADNADVDGFLTLRKCRSGFKIGPLVADTIETVTALFAAARGVTGTEDVSIDVPSTCGDLAAYCSELGMTVSFSTARMYRGTPPVPGPAHHGVATLELG